MARARSCELPQLSRLRSSLSRIDYLDSYTEQSKLAGQSVLEIYAAVLGQPPTVFKHLLVARSVLVRPFGIAGVSYQELSRRIDTKRTYALGDKIGRWVLFDRTENELIVGANDKHLDFRVSILRDGRDKVVLSTAVMTHNGFGRAYLAVILPFHRFGVATLLSDSTPANT